MRSGNRSIRIVSYNVHACIGRDGRFSPGRIVDVLGELDADFIGLQEIEDRLHKGVTVTEYLADRLDMQPYRGATLRRGEAHYGNLLLARKPAKTHRLHDISVPGREPRGVIEADFAVGRQTLRLFVTHLGLRSGERYRQLGQLLQHVGRDDVDLRVLLGDLNEWRPAAATRRLLRSEFGKVSRQGTFPAGRPIFSLDQICALPGDAMTRVRTIRTPLARSASDHLPLLAEFGPDQSER